MGLDIFDGDIFEDEVSFYKTKFNRFGLPLDMRSDYTKSDWLMWSTCLCEDKDYEKAITAARRGEKLKHIFVF